jgi:hypothetical protein
MKKDLLAEHATLVKDVANIRAQIKERFNSAFLTEMRQLQADLFKAENRMESIEKSETWKSRPQVVKVTR